MIIKTTITNTLWPFERFVICLWNFLVGWEITDVNNSTAFLLSSSYFNLSDLYIIITFTSLDFWAGVYIFNMQCKFILPLSCLFFIFRAMAYSEQKAWLWDNVLSVLFLLSNLMDPIITTLKKSVHILGFDVWVFLFNPHTIPLKILPINFASAKHIFPFLTKHNSSCASSPCFSNETWS